MKWLEGCMAALLVCMPAFAWAQECSEPVKEYNITSPDGDFRCFESKKVVRCYKTKEADRLEIEPVVVLLYMKNCSALAIVVQTLKSDDGRYQGLAVNNRVMLYPTAMFTEEEGEKLREASAEIWHVIPGGIFFFTKQVLLTDKKEEITHLRLWGPDGYLQAQTGLTTDAAIDNLVHLVGGDEDEDQGAEQVKKIRFSP